MPMNAAFTKKVIDAYRVARFSFNTNGMSAPGRQKPNIARNERK